MARICYLKDGRREIVLEDKEVFLERLIREELDDDAAELFASYIQETMDELNGATEESECYERSADEYRSMCCDARDARDAFETIIDLLDEPRLDRKALTAAAQNGWNDLNNNL